MSTQFMRLQQACQVGMAALGAAGKGSWLPKPWNLSKPTRKGPAPDRGPWSRQRRVHCHLPPRPGGPEAETHAGKAVGPGRRG